MRVLVLVISDDSHPVQALHRELWRRTTHPEFRVIFVSYRSNLSNPTLDGDTIWIPGEESFPGILRKTIAALDFFANETYDYVIRTNLSSQFRWNILRSRLEGLPRKLCQAGYPGNCHGIHFVSGSGMILSPDVVQCLRDHREEALSVPELDDVAIGKVLTSYGFLITQAPRLDLIQSYQDPRDHAHVRLRNTDPQKRMTVEIEIRKRLIDRDTNPSSQ